MENRQVQRRRYSTGPRYRIEDPEMLAVVVRDAIDEQFGGNTSEAARAIGVSQPQLSRLRSKPGAFINAATYRGLCELMPNEEARWVLDEKVFASEANEVLAEYYGWVAAWNALVADGDPLAREITRRMEREVPEVVNEWKDLLKSRAFTKERLRVSFLRLIHPLLEGQVLAGGVERMHGELSAAEFKRFIRKGWEREKILFRRAPDAVRAQEVWLPARK